ncbi:DUF805 domain-containing protein [Methylomonas sp. AM2-LC]|uniref:DUF805 domain-containing protein n=1 Tax=Methylomonas sp. AM2-LC TaxID=3153301 RepID=UPI003267C8E4
MNYYVNALKSYAVFSGRATRKEYWIFLFFNCIIAFTIGFVSAVIEGFSGMSISSLGNTLNNIYALAVFIPSIAVGVRRMHDIGKNGWWFIFPIVSLVFLCFKSQPNENKYGQPSRVDASFVSTWD